MDIQTRLSFYKTFSKLEPIISWSGAVTTDGTWHQKPLYASYSRLYFVSGGSGVLVSENERMELSEGNIYLIPCGIKVGFYGTPSVTKLFFHINLSVRADGADGVSGSDGEDVFQNFGHFAKIKSSVEHINKLTEWYLSGDEYGTLMLKSEIYRVVFEFLRMEESEQISKSAYSPPVSDSVRYIRSHLTATLTVKEIAEAALCSQSKLSLLFKTEVGQSVSGYIEELLMSEAQTMLLYSDQSVGQISEKLGFCDQFYFSRRFKKRFGVSPRIFRQSKA